MYNVQLVVQYIRHPLSVPMYTNPLYATVELVSSTQTNPLYASLKAISSTQTNPLYSIQALYQYHQRKRTNVRKLWINIINAKVQNLQLPRLWGLTFRWCLPKTSVGFNGPGEPSGWCITYIKLRHLSCGRRAYLGPQCCSGRAVYVVPFAGLPFHLSLCLSS